MTEPVPRPGPDALARRLLDELPEVVTDPAERGEVAARVERALEGGDGDAIADAVVSHARTREWYARVAPVAPDVERIHQGLPGRAPTLSVYYVCPEAHDELVLPARPATPPRCPRCAVEMITEG